jgi:membrane protein involved in colicin uptake
LGQRYSYHRCQRAIEYSIAAFGKGEPDSIIITEEGGIIAKWNAYSRDLDDETEYLSAENLTANLDEVRAERLKKEEEERLQRLEKERQQQILKEKQKTEERKRLYQQLKKEFEP